MYTSLSLTPDSLPDEVRAKSSFPWVWFGFFFVAAFLIEETLEFALELDPVGTKPVLVAIGMAGTIYGSSASIDFTKFSARFRAGSIRSTPAKSSGDSLFRSTISSGSFSGPR
jgi:hypothetical protein